MENWLAIMGGRGQQIEVFCEGDTSFAQGMGTGMCCQYLIVQVPSIVDLSCAQPRLCGSGFQPRRGFQLPPRASRQDVAPTTARPSSLPRPVSVGMALPLWERLPAAKGFPATTKTFAAESRSHKTKKFQVPVSFPAPVSAAPPRAASASNHTST